MENPILQRRNQFIQNVQKSFGIDANDLNHLKTLEKGEIVDELNKSSYDDLQKGEIMDKLVYGYGSSDREQAFKFVKTGKEIKDLLPKCVVALAEQKGAMIAKMNELKEAAGCEPTEVYSGSIKAIKILRYPYDLIRTEYDEMKRSYATATDEQKAAQEYNDMCYSLKSLLEDIVACKIILANVKDDGKYTLSLSQLVALTIGDDLIEA